MPKRTVEVFIAGCPFCDETVKLVEDLACPSCDVQIYNVKDEGGEALRKARGYGINRVPVVLVNGEICSCCRGQERVTREALMAAGVGQA